MKYMRILWKRLKGKKIFKHGRENGSFVLLRHIIQIGMINMKVLFNWMPAFAGMTEMTFAGMTEPSSLA